MIKVLVTSDWHLGNYFHGFERYTEHQHFLAWLQVTVQEEQPDALLIGGDIFDTSNPSAQAQELYYCFLDEVTQRNPGLQVVIIAGNHDSAARLEAPRAMLARRNIFVRGIVTRSEAGEMDYNNLFVPIHSRTHPHEKAFVFTVPYLRDGDYARGEKYAAGVAQFLQEGIVALNQLKEPQEASILLGHLYARGSEIAENSSERIVIGGAEMVNLEEVGQEVTLMVLGHIHKRQCMGGDRTKRYVGSALPMSFAERGYKHGVELALFEEGILVDEPRFIAYPLLRPLCTIPAKAAPIAEIEKLIEALPANEMRVDKPYVEVNVLLDAPNPSVMKQVEELFSKYKKEVHLCSVRSTYAVVGEGNSDELVIESTEDLLTRNPLDIIRKGYVKKHGCEMSSELMELANLAIEAAKTETR